MTALEDLWYGNVRPTERSIVRGSKLDNLMNLLCQNEDDLMNGLTDKQKENEYKVYDTLKSNGLLDKILEAIPENEYNDLITFLAEELELKEKYDLSVSGLISRAINDLPANAEAAMKIVDGFDKEKFGNVIDFAKSINNGQLPTNV